MKPSLVASLLLLAIAGLAWWAFRSASNEPAPVVPGLAPEAPRASGEEAGLGDGGREAEPLRPAAGGTGSDAASGAARSALDVPQAGTRAPLAVTVLDADGAPVEGARVTVESVRAEPRSRGFHLDASTDSAGTARTDEAGGAVVRYPAVLEDGEVTTLATLHVEHPELIERRVEDVPVAPGATTVVLQRAATLVVSGWIGEPEGVVDVTARLSFGTGLEDDGEGAWRATDDGRIAARGFLPGTHSVQLDHVGGDGARWSSRVETFEIHGGERRELALELFPTIDLEGRLSFDVPRPVRGGRVVVGLRSGHASRLGPRLFLRLEAEVADDGTFRIDGVPPLEGELVAVCEGYVSALVPTRDLDMLGVTRADHDVVAEAQRRLGARALGLQELDAREDPGPLVVEMEPAARLTVSVEGPDGAPLAGATVRVEQSFSWDVGVSESWIGGTRATTDAGGAVELATLRGTGKVAVTVDAEDEVGPLALPVLQNYLGTPNRIVAPTLEPGIAVHEAVRLERTE